MKDEDTTAAAVPATAPETKPARRGVGTVITERLLAGDTNEAALAAVKAEFPESSTTKATVSWYRSDLRKTHSNVPTAAEARKAAEPAVPATPAEPATDPLD